MKNRFVNSVCFMRSYDYFGRDASASNLRAIKGQMELYNRYGLPATYLMEYDTLIREDFRAALDGRKANDEVGLWFEVTGELARDAGVEWRSKRNRNWDFYVCPGFIMSYNSEEKKKIIDTMMEKFKSYFGSYPRTVGSWLIDTEAMKYMADHYPVEAFSICREQWGMDGYTLWGGPYYGGYYPTVNNMQTPAQEIGNQIGVPVFRMYLNDPIYCYYEFGKREFNDIDYGLFSTEPVWPCGQYLGWIRYAYECTFAPENLGFSYCQLGQESCFGFDEPLPSGLEAQIRYAVKYQEKYGYDFVTVGDMGKAFRENYKQTPDSFRFTLWDWANKGKQSAWFSNRKYRVNLFSDHKEVWLRDIHFFSDDYRDQYLEKPCRAEWAVYDNPPVMDGVRFTHGCNEEDIPFNNDFSGRKYGDRAAMSFGAGSIVSCTSENGKAKMVIQAEGKTITLTPGDDALVMTSDGDFTINFTHKEHQTYIEKVDEKGIDYRHRDFTYRLSLTDGKISDVSKTGCRIASENGRLVMTFSKR